MKKSLSTIQSKFFCYDSNRQLHCEDVSVKDLAVAYGTPVFITSQAEIEHRYERFSCAFHKLKRWRIFYAVKANYNLNIIRLLKRCGAGMDVNSEGELYRAKQAGVASKDIIMSGVGKSKRDIMAAIKAGIKMIKVESVSELYRIEEMSAHFNKKVFVSLRCNPGVDASTHPYISTGHADSKFGIDIPTIRQKVPKILKNSSNLVFSGLCMHIGSQIFENQNYLEAVRELVALFRELRKKGFNIQSLDIGGGFSSTYDAKCPETPIEETANVLIPILLEEDVDVIFEPGRFLVGNASILATEVLYLKKTLTGKNIIIVDAAMTELIRPTLYSSYHEIVPVQRKKRKNITADVVGPVCESGDAFAYGRKLERVLEGEYLAIMSAGAYSSVLSSSYNARRNAPEVMVSGKRVKEITKRQTLKQLIQNEVL